jgi:hypothetical protein
MMTIVGTIIGYVARLFSPLLSDKIKQRSRLGSDLRAAINEISFVTVTNDYPVALNKLRRIIVANYQALANNKGITEFTKKWLHHPALSLDKPIANFLSPEQISEMLNDLSKIKVKWLGEGRRP